jgi:hypothetical protein
MQIIVMQVEETGFFYNKKKVTKYLIYDKDTGKEVHRRFSHFLGLRNTLQNKYPAHIIPHIEESESFKDLRKHQLECFLQKLKLDEDLKIDSELIAFLDIKTPEDKVADHNRAPETEKDRECPARPQQLRRQPLQHRLHLYQKDAQVHSELPVLASAVPRSDRSTKKSAL